MGIVSIGLTRMRNMSFSRKNLEECLCRIEILAEIWGWDIYSALKLDISTELRFHIFKI
jgi:hypothetical protein